MDDYRVIDIFDIIKLYTTYGQFPSIQAVPAFHPLNWGDLTLNVPATLAFFSSSPTLC